MFFVGNFRHLPNGEAVEYLCRDVLPRLDPDLLAAHPLTVVGSRLDDKVRAHGRGHAEREDGRLGPVDRARTSSGRGSAPSRCCTARASRERSSSR